MRVNPRTRWVSAAIAAAAAVTLTACAGPSEDKEKPASDGPVKIEVWGWNAETGEQLTDAFNAAQDDVEVKYVLQASNTATQTNFQNAFTTGTGVPCLVQGFAPLTTMVVNGYAQDITEYVKPSESLYNSGALAAAEVNGRYYGVPSGSDGQFLIYNKATLDKAGVDVPTTWEEFIATGQKLKGQGIDITNLAGEDPSSLMNLAQQAGAEWFSIDGEEWVVNFLDEGTQQAASVIQSLIDDDLVSNQTYQDKPALYAYFDSGNMATTTTQWWSIGGLQTNLTQSAGNWVATQIPQFSDAKEPVTPGRVLPGFVPVGCEHPEAAMAFTDWLATADGIEAGRNAETGAIGFPTQIADPSPYAADVVSPGFFTDDEQAAEVIAEAQQHVAGKFELGPNYDAWFPELQDQWGKAVAGEITVEQALKNVQDFVAADLKSKGISYKVAD